MSASLWVSVKGGGSCHNPNYKGNIFLATSVTKKLDHYNQYLPSKTAEENGYGAWCDLFYQFSYHIADKKTLTVGERDERIGNMMSKIQDFWNRTDIEEMLSMTEDDIVSKLKEIATEYSNDKITIIIREDSVSFEKMDERSREFD